MQQRALIGSALLADTGSPAPSLVFDRRGDTHFEACIGLPRAPYLIAVASDHEPPPLPPSLYIHRGDLDTETLQRSAIADQLRQTQAELAQATQRAEQATQRVELATQRADQATASGTRRGNTLNRLRNTLNRLRNAQEQAMQRAEQATRHAERSYAARRTVGVRARRVGGAQ
jgi:hypothetical protein